MTDTQESAEALHDYMVSAGWTSKASRWLIDAVTTHAAVVRTKTDAPPGSFRDLATRACRYTRQEEDLRRIFSLTYTRDPVLNDIAATLLHDLIMEGVQ